jgi:hypothetical protein
VSPATFSPPGETTAPLRLLDHVPGFVWQMPLLSRGDIDISALRVGPRIELGWLARIGMHPNIRQIHAGQRLHPGSQSLRQAKGRCDLAPLYHQAWTVVQDLVRRHWRRARLLHRGFVNPAGQ